MNKILGNQVHQIPDQYTEGFLYRVRGDNLSDVVVVESNRGVTWDDSADKFCAEPAILTAKQAAGIIRRKLSDYGYSPVSFYFLTNSDITLPVS